MSFDIASVERATPTTAPASASPAPGERAAKPAPAQTNPVVVDTTPSSPPPQVLDEMGAAAHAADRLAKDDRALHFRIDERSGKLTVEVHDLEGKLLFTVPASKALEIASGGGLD